MDGISPAIGFYGGAIFGDSFSTLTVFGCTLSGNVSPGAGAILFQGELMSLVRCTVTGNNATVIGGGGLEMLAGVTRLTHCTIVGNRSAGGYGGGGGILLLESASLELAGCIVAGNEDTGGKPKDIAFASTGIVSATGNNLIGQNTSVESVFPEGPLAGTAAAPLDPRLGPLGSYGGPTPTLALRPGSPAVDAASDAPTTDQRGIAIVDAADLGAFELRAITVNTVADELDVPAGASVSLREAVRDTFPGATIVFGSSVNSIVLDPAKGELAVGQDATIDGGSNGIVFIDGNDQVLHVLHVTAGHTVNLLGLVIAGGHATGNFPDGYGGGIFNEGKLSLTECAVDTNTADVAGGGIYNTGGASASLTLLRSLVVGNSAAFGGGVQNEAPMVSMASTFFSNRASVEGGAVSAPADGSLQLTHTTIAGNAADTRGGGVRGVNVTIANSIVTENTAPSEANLSGTSILVGRNLVDVPAHFDTFGRHGGPLLTLSLAPDSPALDAAIGSTAATDQRGFPIVGPADIGAFEMQVGPIPDITTNEDTLSPVVHFTVGVVSALDRLFPDGSAVLDQSITLGGGGSARTVRFTPVPNGNGTATITVGDLVSGDARTFHVTVNPVNDAPAFTRGPDLTVFENSGPDSIGGWATNISAGPPDESGQTLTFHMSNDNNALFTDQPVVDANGQISFTPAPGKHGVATVTLDLSDDGGRAKGGVDRSAVQTFTIAVRLMAPESIVQFARGDAAPGRGVTPGLPMDAVLASFNAPAIDESGKIAFVGKWTSGPKTQGTGLFVGSGCLALAGGDASGLTGVSGSTFKRFSDPVISGGRIACLATFSGVPASSASAVLSDVGGSLAIVARAGSSATVDGANFKTFKQVSIVGDAVAFLAQLAPGTGTTPRTSAASDLGLWLKDGATPLVLALREGQSVPGFTAKIRSFTSFAVGNGSPGQGRGWLQAGPVLVPDDAVLARVVLTDGKQAILRVTASSTDAPGILSQTLLAGASGSPQLTGATFASFSLPSINSQLASTFLGTLTPNPMLGITKANGRGIFESTDSGSYAALARVDADSGVSGHAKFSVLKDPVLADDGDLAFAATLKGGTTKGLAATTLWRQLPGSSSATLLAQAGPLRGGATTDLPTGVQWKSFPSLSVAANRGPLFTGTLVVGPGGVKATDASGLWATDYQGVIRTLFRTADMIGGKTLKSFSVLKAGVGSTGVTRSFNGAQKVVWLATFKEDKSQAIVTTEVP